MSEQLADAWIYIVGPIAGALVAVMVAWLHYTRGYQDRHARRCANNIYDVLDVIRICFTADNCGWREIDVQVHVISPVSSPSPSPSILPF